MSGLEEHQPCGAQGVPLINIDTKEVYSRDLLPGAISRGMYVRDWLKRWVNRYWLYKSGEAAVKEQECSEFCHRLGVKCAGVLTIGHGACVKNITTPEVMLEQYDMSGMVDPDGFTVEDVLRNFGWEGLEMVLIDALLGNGDRYADYSRQVITRRRQTG